jgi:beta-aspartyl-peptidase (threonine type)
VRETTLERLPIGSGGIIAINASGEISMQFNSLGMFRGQCLSNGEAEIGVWEDV